MFVQVLTLATLLIVAQAGLLGESIGGGYGHEEHYVHLSAPPKYEFKYGVEDHHTGDLKQQAESRVGDVTKSEYSLAEKDRKIQVSRIIAGHVPVKIVGKY